MPVNSFENYTLTWKPDKKRLSSPVFLSLSACLEEDIAEGRLKPGVMLPPQRELADYLDLNFTTVTRAYGLCREKGLIYGIVGKGTYVSPHAMQILTIPDHSEEQELIRMGYISSFEECNSIVADAVKRAAEKYYLTNLLDYRYMQGHPHHIDAAREWMRFRGIHTDPEHIGIVSGNTNGLSIIMAVLFQPGDAIVVDEYTYPNFMELARIFHVRLIPVCQDEQGMKADHLETVCQQNAVKGIYLMPECCNPTTVCISGQRRTELASVIKKYDLTVIEDNIYEGFFSSRLPSFYTLLPDQTCYLSGISKTISTGLRVSFIAFGERYRERLRYGIYNMNMKTSSLDVEIIADMIFRNDVQKLIEMKNRLAADYNRTFESVFPGEIPASRNSLFRWMRISDDRPGICIEKELYERGVDICHSYRFRVSGHENMHFLRISLSSPGDLKKMKAGLLIIKEYLAESGKRKF